nr:hypothetical protein [Moraxella sp. CTOTU48841]
MANNANLELAKNTSQEVVKIFFDEMLDSWLGKISFGVFSSAIRTRNKLIADKLVEKLKNSQINLDDDLVQSNEFIGYTLKVLAAINTATRQAKIDYLLNIYINGLSDSEFYNRSEKYSELVDIISTLSEDSIVLLIEIYKDYIEQNKVEDSNNAIRITNKLHISYEDFISTCYLLSGKGLIRQVHLVSNSFFPVPTSWLESIIHLLEVGGD